MARWCPFCVDPILSMTSSLPSVAVLPLVLLLSSLLAAQQEPGRGRNGGNKGGGGRGYPALAQDFKTDVPEHAYDLILVRPTPSSITLSVVCYADAEGFVEYGLTPDAMSGKTGPQQCAKGAVVLFSLPELKLDTAYCYRFRFRPAGSEAKAEYAASEVGRFHTPRPAGSAFTFTIQSDSHLDANMTPEVYGQALANALADKPDFHIDIGDTFMTDKRRAFREAAPQYLAQRYWFGRLCHSAPLFMALGNHDGEAGYAGSGPEEIAGWSYEQRTRLFPPPIIAEGSSPGSAMYTGRTDWRDGGGANYFAFEWGSALFCVLDPFWATKSKMRGGGGVAGELEMTDSSWSMSLGRAQYDWLTATLTGSKAKLKFVFLHHLVGGIGRVARGGVEAAPYFEWGGKNADGSEGFAKNRPGWAMPVHALLVKTGVNAVFHGHDHMFVRSELDGITYQCVPQPGNPRGGTRTAAEYGYVSGTILGSPGHLRVNVTDSTAKVAYVRSSLGASEGRRGGGGGEANGTVVHEYELKTRTATK